MVFPADIKCFSQHTSVAAIQRFTYFVGNSPCFWPGMLSTVAWKSFTLMFFVKLDLQMLFKLLQAFHAKAFLVLMLVGQVVFKLQIKTLKIIFWPFSSLNNLL